MVVLLMLGPFLDKAVHIDDPLFVWTAEHILKHPGDFYGFDVNWYGQTGSMAITNCNPPTTSYLLAGVMAIFGAKEIPLHAAMLLVAFAAAAGIFQLAKIWCERPLLATLIALSTPVFFVSATTLMCDVPMLAAWIWAVVFWERALKNGKAIDFLAAGLLAGLSVLTKYSALTLLPLLPLLGVLRKRNLGGWLLWLVVPAVMIELYQFGTAKLYGQGLISAAADYAADKRLVMFGNWHTKIAVGLVYAGGCLLPITFWAPQLWPRRLLLTGAVLLFGPAAAVLLELGGLWRIPDVSGNESASLSFLLQASVMMIGGLHLLILAAAEWWRRRDGVALVIAVWIFSGFIFAVVLNWTVSARSFLPLMPAAVILAVRWFTKTNSGPGENRDWQWPLIAAAVISLLVVVADFRLANSGRTAANQIARDYPPATQRVWFEGHCGFQYYFEKLGALPVDFGLNTIPPGEILVVPSHSSNLIAPDADDVELLPTREFPTCRWLSTVRIAIGAGFYGAGGLFPFAFGPVPAENYFVYKVLQPLQFLPPAAMSEAHANLAAKLERSGKVAEAIAHYQEALHLVPDQPDVLNNLAWLLATCPDPKVRNGTQAVALAQRACEQSQDHKTIYLGTLAAAYAEAGRFDDAITTAQKACALASESGDRTWLKKNQELLALYLKHQPDHEPIEKLVPAAP